MIKHLYPEMVNQNRNRKIDKFCLIVSVLLLILGGFVLTISTFNFIKSPIKPNSELNTNHVISNEIFTNGSYITVNGVKDYWSPISCMWGTNFIPDQFVEWDLSKTNLSSVLQHNNVKYFYDGPIYLQEGVLSYNWKGTVVGRVYLVVDVNGKQLSTIKHVWVSGKIVIVGNENRNCGTIKSTNLYYYVTPDGTDRAELVSADRCKGVINK